MPQRSINQFLIIFGNVGKSYPERDLVQQRLYTIRVSGNSSILPRSNFGVGRQESSPQSLTAYSLNRYKAYKRTQ